MQNEEQKKLRRSFIISSIFHIILVLLFIFGVPLSYEKLPQENQVIVLEMLPVSDVVNVKNQTPKTTEAKEEAKSQRIKNTKSEQKAEASKKTEPKTEQQEPKKEPQKKPETQKDPEPKKNTESIPDEKLKEPKKEKTKPEPEEKKKLEAKKEEKPKKTEVKAEKKDSKKPAKQQEDVIDSILKNLEKESEGEDTPSRNRSMSEKTDADKFAKGNYDENSPLSVTEKMLIKQQIQKNWRPPVGALNLELVQVILNIELEKDGTLINVKIQDIICPAGGEQTCELVAESALRAVKKASPFDGLRPDRYDIWKKFDLRFDPSAMLQ